MRQLLRPIPLVAGFVLGTLMTLAVRLRNGSTSIASSVLASAAAVEPLELVSPAPPRSARYIILASRLSALLACLLMALAAVYFQPSTGGKYLKEAAAFMVAGAVALWLALWLRHKTNTLGRGERAVRPYNNARARSPLHEGEGPGVRVFPINRLNRIALALGIVYLVVIAEISGNLLRSPLFAGVSHHAQFVLFAAGIIFVTWGLGAGRLRRERHEQQPATAVFQAAYPDTVAGRLPASGMASPPLRVRGGGRGVGFSYDFWLILPIILLAFALRFWQLGSAVHHFVDEIHFSSAVANFWRAPDYNAPLLAPFGSITAFPWLYPYLQSGAVGIFGRNLEGLRALSAALGTLTIPALYLLAKTLFGRKTALAAALLLATFPPHINFSRIGLNNVADPLFGTLALAFLGRGVKHGRRMDFAIAGAFLGLTQYFYEGGRFLFIFLPCLWLIWLILTRRFNRPQLPPQSLRTHHRASAVERHDGFSPPLRARGGGRGEGLSKGLSPHITHGLVTFLIAAFLVAAPVYYALAALQRPFAQRMDIVGVGGSYWIRAFSVGGAQTLDQHLLVPLLTYVFMPEQALYYGGDHPMILESFVPLFLLGAAYAIWRWRGSGMLLLLWVGLTSAGNSLMTYAAIYARYVVAFPALALLMALGVRSVVPLILPSRIYRRFGVALVVIIIVAVGVMQTGYYFGPHLERYNIQMRTRADEEDAIFRSLAFPLATRIHLVTWELLDESYVYGVLGYVSDRLSVTIVRPDQITPDYLLGLSRRIDHAFYVEQKDTTTPQTLAQYFTVQPPAYSPFNVPRDKQYVLYYITGLWNPSS
jgi:hypothetical protein